MPPFLTTTNAQAYFLNGVRQLARQPQKCGVTVSQLAEVLAAMRGKLRARVEALPATAEREGWRREGLLDAGGQEPAGSGPGGKAEAEARVQAGVRAVEELFRDTRPDRLVLLAYEALEEAYREVTRQQMPFTLPGLGESPVEKRVVETLPVPRQPQDRVEEYRKNPKLIGEEFPLVLAHRLSGFRTQWAKGTYSVEAGDGGVTATVVMRYPIDVLSQD